MVQTRQTILPRFTAQVLFQHTEEKDIAFRCPCCGGYAEAVRDGHHVTVEHTCLKPKRRTIPQNLRKPVSIDYKKVAELYEQGLSDSEIARRVKCGSSAIGRWRKRNGKPCNFQVKRLSDHEVEAKIAELYATGLSQRKIAEQVGVSATTVKTWVKRQKKQE